MSPAQDATAEPELSGLTIGDPMGQPVPNPVTVPTPDETWDLSEGHAWVFYGEGKPEPALTQPVIISDGFNLGPSDPKLFYQFLESKYPFISELRRCGKDVILLGFNERSASILTNVRAAEEAIEKTIEERSDTTSLVVGGFSMGGLVTRYALAKMEKEGRDHQTSVYFSFDTPHRGASIPVGVQAFSYFIPFPNNPFARQMNSPAARQMLWRHYDKGSGEIKVAKERLELLAELERVGGWPQGPRLLGVANGRGDGVGLPDVKPGHVALHVDRIYPGTTFHIQDQGKDVTVAHLNRRFPEKEETIKTSGFPELDGAPGGTLNTYGILAKFLSTFLGDVDLRHEEISFVPSVSAVTIRDIERQADLYTKVDDLDPSESALHEFICSSTTTRHAVVTEELGTWLIERFDHS